MPSKANVPAPSAATLAAYVGEYRFSALAGLRVTSQGGRLLAQSTGPRRVYAIGTSTPVELEPSSATEFFVPGRVPLVLSFAAAGRLVINPGHWAQTATRVSARPPP